MPGAEKQGAESPRARPGRCSFLQLCCLLEGIVCVHDPETFLFSSSGAPVPPSGKGQRVRAGRLLYPGVLSSPVCCWELTVQGNNADTISGHVCHVPQNSWKDFPR